MEPLIPPHPSFLSFVLIYDQKRLCFENKINEDRDVERRPACSLSPEAKVPGTKSHVTCVGYSSYVLLSAVWRGSLICSLFYILMSNTVESCSNIWRAQRFPFFLPATCVDWRSLWPAFAQRSFDGWLTRSPCLSLGLHSGCSALY
jgi:hypothetical protein